LVIALRFLHADRPAARTIDPGYDTIMHENRNKRQGTSGYLSAQSLVDWLNGGGSQEQSTQEAIAAYIRWRNAGKPGSRPMVARRIFVEAVSARLREAPELDLAPYRNRDFGVLRLVEADRNGLLSRLRECPGCSLWFFADNAKRMFCSVACRVKAWRKTTSTTV